jgi:hypothetical protein
MKAVKKKMGTLTTPTQTLGFTLKRQAELTQINPQLLNIWNPIQGYGFSNAKKGVVFKETNERKSKAKGEITVEEGKFCELTEDIQGLNEQIKLILTVIQELVEAVGVDAKRL